jgi:hypothetical protein
MSENDILTTESCSENLKSGSHVADASETSRSSSPAPPPPPPASLPTTEHIEQTIGLVPGRFESFLDIALFSDLPLLFFSIPFVRSLFLGSPIPSKARRLLDEGKISPTEYVTLLTSDKSFREDEDIDQIPWRRISLGTMESTGPLIVIEKEPPAVMAHRLHISPHLFFLLRLLLLLSLFLFPLPLDLLTRALILLIPLREKSPWTGRSPFSSPSSSHQQQTEA